MGRNHFLVSVFARFPQGSHTMLEQQPTPRLGWVEVCVPSCRPNLHATCTFGRMTRIFYKLQRDHEGGNDTEI